MSDIEKVNHGRVKGLWPEFLKYVNGKVIDIKRTFLQDRYHLCFALYAFFLILEM